MDIEGSAVGQTLYYGAGAGAEPTASAVVADLIDLARHISVGQSDRLPALGVVESAIAALPVVPMAEVETIWYLRIQAEDKPGVLSQVGSVFSERGISIESLIQKAPAAGQSRVSLVVLTNTAAQSNVESAVQALESLATIHGDIVRLRVETLDG